MFSVIRAARKRYYMFSVIRAACKSYMFSVIRAARNSFMFSVIRAARKSYMFFVIGPRRKSYMFSLIRAACRVALVKSVAKVTCVLHFLFLQLGYNFSYNFGYNLVTTWLQVQLHLFCNLLLIKSPNTPWGRKPLSRLSYDKVPHTPLG